MRIVTAVEGCHQSALDVAVAQTERVPKFVSRDLEEISTAIASDGPSFRIVKVSIATVYGKIRVRQGTTRSIERITVPVLAYLESDLDVNLNKSSQSLENIIISIVSRKCIRVRYFCRSAFVSYVFASCFAGEC